MNVSSVGILNTHYQRFNSSEMRRRKSKSFTVTFKPDGGASFREKASLLQNIACIVASIPTLVVAFPLAQDFISSTITRVNPEKAAGSLSIDKFHYLSLEQFLCVNSTTSKPHRRCYQVWRDYGDTLEFDEVSPSALKTIVDYPISRDALECVISEIGKLEGAVKVKPRSLFPERFFMDYEYRRMKMYTKYCEETNLNEVGSIQHKG